MVFGNATLLFAQTTTTSACPIDPRTNKMPECCDGIDNDNDGRADFYGATINGKTYPPDPKCLYKEDTEQDRATGSKIVPCTDKCNIESVFLLANNIIKFFFTTLLIPIVVILFVYAGVSYILAQGNPGKKVKLGKLIWHIVLGIVLILTAWLIVRVVLNALGITDGLIFFG